MPSHTRGARTPSRRLGLAALAAALLAAGPAAATPRVGVACTSGGPNPTFTLRPRWGYINLPDGNTMYMWSYAEVGKPFQHPGPVLCVTEGDTVTVVLQNPGTTVAAAPWGETSLVFPGQEGVLANGVPSQPQFSGATLTSLATAAPPGGSVTYSFVAGRPGSFLYHSGSEPARQVRMGLFGALIVRPLGDAAQAYNRADSRFTPSEEFMILLSEIDPFQHQAAERGVAFDLTAYHPRYWLLNGRAFPDIIADNGATWLPTQPYGGLARIYPWDATSHPDPGRIHYLNVGTENFPFHPHGNNGLVIGREGAPLAAAGGTGADLSFEKFAINIGPGQTWDVLFRWNDAEGYSPANPVPVTMPDVANIEFGPFFSGSPYLGVKGPLPPGLTSLNQCGEHYIITHNHALFQITSWGMTMSGAISYLRIDPPLPNTCP